MEKETIRFGERGLPIFISRLFMQSDKAYRGMHSHPAIEIVQVKSGRLTFQTSQRELVVYPNQILIINSNVGHRLLSDDANIIYFQFDESRFQDELISDSLNVLHKLIARSKEQPYKIFTNNDELSNILQKTEDKYYDVQEHSHRYLKAYIYELIAFMYTCSFLTIPDLSSRHLKKIEPIVRYIDQHIHSAITLDEICRELGYSKHTICHTFKQATGVTVFDYINYLRIQCAIEKLKQNNSTILEIASECGFASATYFNRVFKNIIGCTPSEYRKHIFKPRSPCS